MIYIFLQRKGYFFHFHFILPISLMTSLLKLPGDILSIITLYLTAFDIGRLWLCCNKQLMINLENSITYFYYCLPKRYQIDDKVYAWPTLIHRLSKLQQLIIDPASKCITPGLIDVDSDTLFSLFTSTTLTHVTLRIRTRPEIDTITTFPAQLARFSWSQDITDDSISTLPKGLTSLVLCEYKNTLTDACVAHLPRGLTILNLGGNQNLTDDCIEALPSGLTSLFLDYNNKLTDNCVGSLPQGLINLLLRLNRHFTDDCITLLPKKLQYLDLSWNNMLTNACIPSLPKELTQLFLYSDHVTEACFPHLPPDLVDFACPFMDSWIQYRQSLLSHKTC